MSVYSSSTGGSNIINDQYAYDSVYTDVIINSRNRNNSPTPTGNLTRYPNIWQYSINLTKSLERIFKVELVNVTIPFKPDSSGFIPKNVYSQYLILSINPFNGDTVYAPADGTDASGNQNQALSNFFCQVPDNSYVQGGSNYTITPSGLSAIQFFNPPITKVNKLDITLYGADGSLLNNGNLLDHNFTLRVHYFQRRNGNTFFSTAVINR
jgi:hypothetical protein